MHEFSLAQALLSQVLEHARRNSLERVEKVEIEVGALQMVVPEMLDTAFAAVAKGSAAEGAALIQREAALEAECRRCGSAFTPAIDRYRCPRCGEADAAISAGREVILRSLSGPAAAHGESE